MIYVGLKSEISVKKNKLNKDDKFDILCSKDKNLYFIKNL